ncbi:response regulator [Elizabethkingia anophelis]|uniref:DNA-binding response regulator n=1 Tax=Elizabethkingia anophelis TaxID=1117645 RepID=A0AAU8UYA1_9FLAO|nr:response regulator transcription factor [Elizabethkingia anophelis]AQX02828.1 DNA-binding response regulator [Elizabethkingia anophelis]OPB56812.1 DNA-binding response regulator [Elizabethkingia anophelis]
MKHRIAIVDDHPLISEGINHLISKNTDLNVVGNFINGESFLQYIATNQVDLVLLDISLPDINGIDLCLKIKQSNPEIIVLPLSNHIEKSAVMKMLQNGANGYMLKNASAQELIDSIHRAIEGQIVFSKSIQEVIIKPDNTSFQLTNLTTREKEVLLLLAEGLTASRIAEKLFLSKFTVENHRKNIFQKMGVNNVAALIAEAAKTGLI